MWELVSTSFNAGAGAERLLRLLNPAGIAVDEDLEPELDVEELPHVGVLVDAFACFLQRARLEDPAVEALLREENVLDQALHSTFLPEPARHREPSFVAVVRDLLGDDRR